MSGNVELCKDLSHSCGKFTSKFYSTITEQSEGNLASSPLSLHYILSWLTDGAAGETAKELKTVLHIDESKSLADDCCSLISTLNNLTATDLSLANSIYLQEGAPFVPEFVTRSTNLYKSEVNNVNFGDNENAASEINSWVSQKTKDKIKNIINPNHLNSLTRAVLVNAIYFKAPWANKFNPKLTEPREFYCNGKKVKRVPMMFKKHKYTYGHLPTLKSKFLEIPYENEQLDMVIILPHEINGLGFVEKNFDWGVLKDAFRTTGEEIELYLPKFKIDSSFDLKEPLQSIGINLMFDDGTADFRNMTPTPGVFVKKVIQKVFVEVNEQGSEAAAATAAIMAVRSLPRRPERFLVDRPFIFVIRHKTTNIPLFIGSVEDFQ